MEEPIRSDNSGGDDSRGAPSPSSIQQQLETIDTVVEDLQRACAELPHVEPDGSSECPFAEALYAKKERLWDRLVQDLPRLNGWLRQTDAEIARCRRNLSRLLSDSSRLSLEEASTLYSEAEDAQAAEYSLWKDCRSRVAESIGRVTAALAAAGSKRFPGKEPQESPGPLMLSASSYPDPSESPSGSDDQQSSGLTLEVRDLLSLGPLSHTRGGAC